MLLPLLRIVPFLYKHLLLYVIQQQNKSPPEYINTWCILLSLLLRGINTYVQFFVNALPGTFPM